MINDNIFFGWERGNLTHDETTIITGALELTEKTTKDAMTPISNAISLDLDALLPCEFMDIDFF